MTKKQMKRNETLSKLKICKDEDKAKAKEQARLYWTAAKAITKQIPMRGINKGKFSDLCPNCKETIYMHMKYCTNCGQRLLWDCQTKGDNT